ncbi:DUF1109 domain-containing protein [Aquabacter sp. CN5-332]|uniref:DUF1109 domain-containing protein n=1 Tax=Aquabacter sp. CN5-332 TaxID=3156608 RepID=UPI0032B41706
MTRAKSETIIDLLVADLIPIRPGSPARYIGAGLILGMLVSSAVVLLAWGPRSDWNEALFRISFWMKAAFTATLSLSGYAALLKLARPECTAPLAARAIGTTILVMGITAGLQLALAQPGARLPLVFGATSGICSWLIMALSAPILCGTLLALRFTAPTRLRLTGASAGLTAGALSAAVYAIACDESGMPFVFLWYGLAITAVSLFGAVIGPRLLRW